MAKLFIEDNRRDHVGKEFTRFNFYREPEFQLSVVLFDSYFLQRYEIIAV